MKFSTLKITCFLVGSSMLAACENPITMETKVHDDGSLDKSITLERTDSFRVDNNMFGINGMKGWKVDVTRLPEEKEKGGKNKVQYRIQFQKSFSDDHSANAELDRPTDTLFRIHSTFRKEFRWFFTYIRYSELIRPLNRFKMVSPDDFFNREDKEFIMRLPGEGKTISKADSLYLQVLNEKISNNFANMAIFKEQYKILEEAVKAGGLGKNWLDTLSVKQEYIYDHVDKMKGDPLFAQKMADSLRIPLDMPRSAKVFKELSKDFNQRLDFMSFAHDGKYRFSVEMPWTVTQSNADSVSGKTLFWRPVVTKFVWTGYILTAESRKMNIWAIAVSVGIVVFTAYMFRRRQS